MKNQYDKIKEQYPDAVLLFRCGDIYECYHEDAQVCQDILGITSSNRDGMQVSGFPFHALDAYLPRLVRAGKRVAICDEIETKEQIIKRECDMTKGESVTEEDVKRELCKYIKDNEYNMELCEYINSVNWL